jgi:hypothetical protein
MRIFITKYGLTKGIYLVDANPTIDDESEEDQMVFFRLDPRSMLDSYAHHGQYATTEEEARQQVAKIAEKKIACLKKQIRKLETWQPKLFVIKETEV